MQPNYIISFIGGGFSSNAILRHLSKLAIPSKKYITINIFDEKDLFGVGVAYNTKFGKVMLNAPKHIVSLDSNNKPDYYRWDEAKAKFGKQYTTRKAFGEYLQARLREIITALKHQNFTVNFIISSIINIKQLSPQNYIVYDALGKAYKSNIIVLATGNTMHKDYYQLTSKKNYLANAYYNYDIVTNLPKQPVNKILILGSSLSAIDCMLLLYKNNFKGQIYCFSRSGLLPFVRNENNKLLNLKALQKLSRQKSIKLFEVMQAFNQELTVAGLKTTWKNIFNKKPNSFASFINYVTNTTFDGAQEVITSLDKVVEDIWHKLSLANKKYFMDNCYKIFTMQRSPIPLPSGQIIVKMLAEHKLRLIAGAITEITTNPDNTFAVTFNRNNQQKFDFIINAMGVSKDITDIPLYHNILQKDFCRKNPLGGIDVDFNSNNVLNKDGVTTPNMFAIGAITQGAYLINNDTIMFSERGLSIAKAIVKLINT